MKKLFFLAVAPLCAFVTHAQYIVKLSIQKSEDKTPLVGATAIISSIHKTTITDSFGIATFENIPEGSYSVRVSYVGFTEKEVPVRVPQVDSAIEVVLLEQTKDEEEEVVIKATRTSRFIKDIPTRVEIISGEELAEKANMKPGDIRMMLNESTGIQTQQTSA